MPFWAKFNIKVDLFRLELREIQSDSLEEIATEKAVAAYRSYKRKIDS